MKFVHAADLHLDSPLRGLARYDAAPVDIVRGASRRALENLTRMCIEQSVDLLLIAGDIYDGDWKDYNTGLFFHQQLNRLSRQGIRVVLVRGNHDAASQISRSLALPDGVVELDTAKAETVLFDDIGAAVHGRGYPRQELSENIVPDYPSAVAGYFNIGLLHTALDGREGHAPYAPCRVPELIAKNYDYWALGHVHQREIVHTDPLIVFPGNLQGRHVRETGAKGVTVVTVSDGSVVPEHCVLDVLRWARCDVDLSATVSAEDFISLATNTLSAQFDAAQGRPLAARIQLTGVCRYQDMLSGDRDRWINELRAAANEISDEIWLERVVFDTRADTSLESLTGGNALGPLAGLRETLQAAHADPGQLRELQLELIAAIKLPNEYQRSHEALDLDDPAVMLQLLREAEQLLVHHLSAAR